MSVSSAVAFLENRFYDEVVGKQNAELLNDLLGDDFNSHHFPQPGQNNKAAFIGRMKSLFKRFPKIRIVRNVQYRIANVPHDHQFKSHPEFGPLSRKDVGRLCWRHLDHHLRQFSA